MVRLGWLAVVAGIGGAGCTPAERPVGSCLFWEDCGPGGACEYAAPQASDPLRFACSFADPRCAVTGRRFGELATPELAGACVPYTADAFDAFCDDDHACSHGRSCAANRCISYAGLTASGGMTAAVCTHDPSEGGDLWAWGIAFQLTGEASIRTQFGEGTVPPPAGSTAPPIATRAAQMGAVHLCVLGAGFSECQGRGDRLGNGALGSWGRATPLGPHGALSASTGHTCGARAGAIDCWGDNSRGQLDGVPGATSAAPRTTPFTGRLVGLAAGGTFSCVATPADVTCWGGDWAPATFAGGVLQGLPVGGTLTAIDAGDRHGCVVQSGKVWCWGTNTAGQVTGAGTAFPVPATQVALPSDAIAVAAGAGHSCAVTVDGEIWCWGDNFQGQLGGPGKSGGPVRVPFDIPASGLIAAGQDHTCAVLADSLVHCWGAPQVVAAPTLEPRMAFCL